MKKRELPKVEVQNFAFHCVVMERLNNSANELPRFKCTVIKTQFPSSYQMARVFTIEAQYATEREIAEEAIRLTALTK